MPRMGTSDPPFDLLAVVGLGSASWTVEAVFSRARDRGQLIETRLGYELASGLP